MTLAAIGVYRWYGRAAAADGPIVLISIDTLRADHLPTYGYKKVVTPAIDTLAADGIVFQKAYSHSPQTLPSHTSILSGRLPFEHGVRDNLGFIVAGELPLMQGLLRSAGFRTGGFVSAYVLRQETGIGRGFDLYDSQMPPASPETSIALVQRDGSATLQAAARWLDTLDTSRFFLFLHIYEPHTPYAPPAQYERYQPYDGEIAYADEIVGRLFQSLRDRKLYDRATIVLLSDHGEGLGDHVEQEHGVFLYDEALHVPLVVKLPGQRAAGRRVSQPVQHIDVLPTVADLTGLAIPQGLRGRSLKPLLTGGAAVADQGIYSEALYPRYHFGWSELVSLTDSRYRYIKAPHDELYDLERDPGERQNLAGEQSQVRAAMRRGLDALLAGSRIHRPSRVSDEDRQRLQALGYIGSDSTAPDTSGESLPDPKDKVAVLERYRQAVNLTNQRRFLEAVRELRAIAVENPTMTDVWLQLGNMQMKAGDAAGAIESYRKVVERSPKETGALVSLASALVRAGRLDEAKAHARLAADLAGADDLRTRANAYDLLARVALRQNDPEGARRSAEAGESADGSLPLKSFIEGVILHDAGKYAAALPQFEAALGRLENRTFTLLDLHFYAADCLARLGRNREAEAHFREELRFFPQNLHARASLASFYWSNHRDADAERAITELLRVTPTPEGDAMAERLWIMFGQPQRAAAVRMAARQQR